ncbi:MAG: hypothetical protein QXR73_01715, partial [Candidatus Micrarchaeaceae archaeon]
RFLKAVKIYRPKLICFIGKTTYGKFSGTKKVDYGFKEPIHGIKVYVCRFPIRGPADERIKELKRLKRYY